MEGHSQGGNDTLIGGASGTILYGDAQYMSDHAHGGNDTLISGTGTERLGISHDFYWLGQNWCHA